MLGINASGEELSGSGENFWGWTELKFKHNEDWENCDDCLFYQMLLIALWESLSDNVFLKYLIVCKKKTFGQNKSSFWLLCHNEHFLRPQTSDKVCQVRITTKQYSIFKIGDELKRSYKKNNADDRELATVVMTACTDLIHNDYKYK